MADDGKKDNVSLKTFVQFYSTCIKHLARRVSEAGKRDFMLGLAIAVCTGIAAFLLGDHDWLKAMIIAVAGLVLWFWCIAILHFSKTPVSIRLDAHTEAKAKSETRTFWLAGIGILIFLMIVPSGLMWWWCSGQSLERESTESLRRRTIKLSDELEDFWVKNPAPAQQGNKDAPDYAQKQQAFADYEQRVRKTYQDRYRVRLLEIIRTYKQKGIPIGSLEADAENQVFGAAWFSSSGFHPPTCQMDEVCQLRQLAWFVDAKDNPITQF